jgi:type I restriction enzyme S subunit
MINSKMLKGWRYLTLKEISDPNDKFSFKGGPFGSDLKSAHYTESGVRVLQLQDIGKGYFLDKSQIYTSAEKADELEACNVYPGDILLAKMSPVARCCIVPGTDERYVMCSDGIRLSVDKSKVDRDFVYYALNDQNFLSQAESKSTGTTRARIGLSDLRNISIFCPPLAEQKKISSTLSILDEKIDLVNQKILQTQQLKIGLMQTLFTKGVGVRGEDGNWKQHNEYQSTQFGEIPFTWDVISQQNVATFYNGRAYKRTEWEDTGTPVIRLQNLTGTGKKYYYSNLELPERQYVNHGDLLFMWSATFGPKFWYGEKAIYHYHIWKVECDNSRLDKKFMFYNLSYTTEKMKKETNGSTMLHFTKKGMEEQLMLLPSLEEQQKISGILTTVDEKLGLLKQQKRETQLLKKGLMQKLLTGEWRVPLDDSEAA